ncbi:MAG: hypothetical protein A3F84_07570 [Candidatus Handelsmanbacteria bacterium RIFCSPLOWO2_12_FULL_64_10]|uniref:ATP-grasp domain-containing protein n=1 Tax=Handelsmanbacteria sp. (strain RIFCSPLOWO2_12_FULL_64_10) TaxID=1817868 RepID=A0A1F6CRH2_HANXR|nr:MAG: hypothetical protein A3F84_07570 [Candidatus Handelsmanbacteria bacterium RIFCSPLOWO2_12_FULL_64_10]
MRRGTAAGDEDAEWDSPETIAEIRRILAARHEVIAIEADDGAYENLRAARPDFVFNMAEGAGGAGRESFIPTLLERFGIPYLGADPTALGVCLHKAHCKEVLLAHALPTAPFVVWDSPGRRLPPFGLPAVVKPLHEGSSKGITDRCLVRTAADLMREVERIVGVYRQPAIVEKFLPGREFTAAMLGNGASLEILPLVEVDFSALPDGSNPIYSYEAKWIWDVPSRPLNVFHCPAIVEDDLRREIESICREAFVVLGCRDWCRVDLRLDERGRPSILEVNPLPGILPRPEENSCFPKAARAAGMDYAALVHRVLDIALRRCGLPVSEEAAASTV